MRTPLEPLLSIKERRSHDNADEANHLKPTLPMQRRKFLRITGQIALASTSLFMTGCGAQDTPIQAAPAPVVPAAPAPATPTEQAPDDMQLFLLIGQSNMAGRGKPEAQDKATDAGIWMLGKEKQWTLARAPIHFDKPAAGVGPGHQFARTLKAKEPGANIGLIPAAMGGSSLDQWKVGGKLYNDAVERAREAMKHGKLKGILWHQGESDSKPEKIASYPGRFAAMIAQLRTDLGAENVPVVIGELVYSRDASAEFNKTIPTISAAVPNSGWVSAKGLTDKGDKLHFSAEGARTLGERYAAKFLELEKAK